MKKYIVTVLVNKPFWVDYEVEAESEEEAREEYAGFPVINEEMGEDVEEVVSVEEK